MYFKFFLTKCLLTAAFSLVSLLVLHSQSSNFGCETGVQGSSEFVLPLILI